MRQSRPMRKFIVSQFVSVDGVIEDPVGIEDLGRGAWSSQSDSGAEGGQFKVDEMMSSEAMLMGRRTYEGYVAAWPSRGGAYADKISSMPKYVVSTTLKDPDLDELWLAEDCFLHGGLTAAAVALASTQTLAVGVGLLPTTVRNPAIAAMELGTLGEIFPGRFQAAFGHGVEAWMRQIGARPPDRIEALREVVGAVRALLDGETVDVDGRAVTLREVRLARPPARRPPLLVGSTGERAIRVAAELADGVLLPEGAGPDAVAWVRDRLPPAATIGVYAWLRIDEDGDRARERVVPTVRRWRDGGLYPRLVDLGGVPATVGSADVPRVAIAGTPSECAGAVRELADAGATTLVVMPVGEERTAQLERFAREVIPLCAPLRPGPELGAVG